MTENPLLSTSSLPHKAVPFDRIQPEHFLPALDATIREARQTVDGIINNTMAPDFPNTIEALEGAGERVDWVAGVFYNLLGAETSEEMQKLAQEIGPRLAGFSSDLLLNPRLFSRVREVHDKSAQLKLTNEQRRLLENTYSEFARNGALLKDTAKQRLREIDQRLSQLGPQFSENVLKSTNAFEMYLKTAAETDGLPEGYLEAAKAAAEAKGRPGEFLITLQFPSYMPFMKFATHRPSRERLARASGSRAFNDPFDNQKNILEIVNLRHERANLLGYRTHAHFVLERRMAESPDRVQKFLDDLLDVTRAAAARDISQVQEFADSSGGPRPLQPWDFAFYSEKLKEKLFNYNEEDLRPYFQLEKVIDGVFQVSGRLFGLRFESSSRYPTYHPDVKVFEVYKDTDGSSEFMGLFYADFFPRPTKRDGAWMTNFFEQGHERRPHVSIVCNFTKSTPSKPSLLTMVEVQTLFHEFGHALHSLMSRCHYRTLSGTNVYWDFVELPSQLLENWTYEKEALDLFAHHYKTGEPMPQELIDKVRKSSKFLAGYNSLRQLNFAFLDMAWYNADPKEITDVAEFELNATRRTTILPRIPGTNGSSSFSHIFGGGYSAGYYSYKWAEVLDADAFELFKEKGIFNPEVAEKLEAHILSRGGSEHPSELYRRFRGREPDPKALLRRDGLIQ